MPLSCMIHLPHRVLQELQANARAHVPDIEDLAPVASLTGGVYLPTEFAPEQTGLGVRDPCKACLLEGPDRLRIVADDAPSGVATRPSVVVKERRTHRDDRVHLRGRRRHDAVR